MQSFQSLWDRAVARKGLEALEKRLPQPKSNDELGATPDDRYLAMMTKGVFSAGFVWRVVEAKWDGFENAFHGFDPHWAADAGDDDLEVIANDKGVIRNRPKIKTVFENARFVRAMATEHGTFGQWIADWPATDIIGLWAALKKGGSRLGGNTGPMFLRHAGKDTFLLWGDVVASLIEQGIIDKKPTGKRAQAAVQDAFNRWHEESGRPLCQISVTLACTIDSEH